MSHPGDEPTHDTIVELLNGVLTAELTAVNQYFLHAKMCAHWGYEVLASKIRAESIDEMRHADVLIDRILTLKGLPNVQRLGRVRIGETVPEQLRADLALEKEAIPALRAGIHTCRRGGDHTTAGLLEAILAAEEAHAEWIETQLELIEKLSEAVYLAQQLRS
ncbi:MAG: bacterioferritin [Deltaproteobacteria bacterium]|nr:bacterioferritin [Deltaproteobacteria bacterium]